MSIVVAPLEPMIRNARLSELVPPVTEISGVMTEVTSAVTSAVSAVPMTTARSTTFPRSRKSLNPLSAVSPSVDAGGSVTRSGVSGR